MGCDAVPFSSWVQLSGFLLLAQRLRLPAWLPDECLLLLLPSFPAQVLPAAFPLPGTGGSVWKA